MSEFINNRVISLIDAYTKIHQNNPEHFLFLFANSRPLEILTVDGGLVHGKTVHEFFMREAAFCFDSAHATQVKNNSEKILSLEQEASFSEGFRLLMICVTNKQGELVFAESNRELLKHAVIKEPFLNILHKIFTGQILFNKPKLTNKPQTLLEDFFSQQTIH